MKKIYKIVMMDYNHVLMIADKYRIDNTCNVYRFFQNGIEVYTPNVDEVRKVKRCLELD